MYVRVAHHHVSDDIVCVFLGLVSHARHTLGLEVVVRDNPLGDEGGVVVLQCELGQRRLELFVPFE